MLTISGLFAGYGSGDVLRGVDLTVAEGSVTCVVGPNGAGKSTLLKIVSGLLRPRLGIVQVMQSRNLFPELTVRENVELGGFLLRDAGLVRKRMAEVSGQFPIVAERASDRAGQLSGGQQRMVEFARALMLDPALVVLDEPSMGLEPRAAALMYASIKRMTETGRTVLLVDHGVVMEPGRVRLEGTGAEILANPQMRALYLGGTVEEGEQGEVPAGDLSA